MNIVIPNLLTDDDSKYNFEGSQAARWMSLVFDIVSTPYINHVGVLVVDAADGVGAVPADERLIPIGPVARELLNVKPATKFPPLWQRKMPWVFSRGNSRIEVFNAHGCWWFKPGGQYMYGPFHGAVLAMHAYEQWAAKAKAVSR